MNEIKTHASSLSQLLLVLPRWRRFSPTPTLAMEIDMDVGRVSPLITAPTVTPYDVLRMAEPCRIKLEAAVREVYAS